MDHRVFYGRGGERGGREERTELGCRLNEDGDHKLLKKEDG